MRWKYGGVLFCLSLIFSGVLIERAEAKGKSKRRVSAPYPRIHQVLGQAFLVSDLLTVEKREAQIQQRQKQLKKGEVLRDKARIRVVEKAEVEIQLSETARILILENSEIFIPGISWDRGEIFQVHLEYGKIRILCAQKCQRNFTTALSESLLPEGDFVLSYDPQMPSVGFDVLAGEVPFRGLGNESELVLRTGERATFTGVIQEGVPAFDILLKGRKVAQGKVSEIQKISETEMQKWKQRDEMLQKKLKKAAQALIVKRTPQQICDQPLGELGQCAWKCEKNPPKAKGCAVQMGALCVRTRCNANGVWSDRTEVSAVQSRCELRTVVGTCDY